MGEIIITGGNISTAGTSDGTVIQNEPAVICE